nr:putative nuclease HARBI1 [Penaeus vannamei]
MTSRFVYLTHQLTSYPGEFLSPRTVVQDMPVRPRKFPIYLVSCYRTYIDPSLAKELLTSILHVVSDTTKSGKKLDAARRKRRFKKRRDPFEYYCEEEFTQRYRISKDIARDLLRRISHRLPSSRNRRGLPIPRSLQLLIAVRYMATGSFQLSVADCTDVAQPSVCKYLRIVAKAIADLAPEFISFPEPEQEQDGCHVPIQNPGGQNPELYRCRKGWMSINVMAVCDASVKFTDLVVGWPGSAHDSRIFTSSAL